MCQSIFLAQILGCYLVIVNLAMLMHHQRFKKTISDLLGNAALLTVTGGIALIVGLLIVGCHNVWVNDWPVVITVTGWLFVLQGVMRIFVPDMFVKYMRDMMAGSGYTLLSWAWLIAGVYLIWAGFTQA